MIRIIGFALAFICCINIQAQTWTNLEYNPNLPGLELNPLKGFSTMWNPSNNFPRSIQARNFGLKELMTGMTTFNWAAMDNFIKQEAAKGNFSSFQVNIDPADGTTLMPAFLINQIDWKKKPGSLCPDWDNEILMQAMLNFISAFGEKYDTDSRLFLVGMGLYGMWGEWHVGSDTTYQMTPKNQIRIANAYKAAFPTKRLMARYSGAVPDPQLFGYSDGLFFGQSIDKSNTYYFHNMLKRDHADQNWKQHVIGGEIDPGLQGTIWKTWPNTVGQDVSACMDSIHPTFLFSHYLFTMTSKPGSAEWDNAIRAQKMMGYTFFLNKYQLSASEGKPAVEVMIQNKGVAPMYANWDIEIGVLDASKTFKSLGVKKWNLDLIQPSETDNYRSILSSTAIADGTYKVLLRIVNPLTAASAKPVRFANTTQDADKVGWLSLGDITIVEGKSGVIPIPATEISLPDTSATITVGNTLQLSATVSPSNATNKLVTWVTDHPATASVSSTGLVTAGPLIGEAIISAFTHDGGFLSKSIITVDPKWINLPEKVEAENFIKQSGIQTENCYDAGRGLNVGYVDSGDWMLYAINNTADISDFDASFRLSSPSTGGLLTIFLDDVNVGQISVPNTYGWQNWKSVTKNLTISKGNHYLKIFATKGGFNINNIDFKTKVTSIQQREIDEIEIYPIPAEDFIQISSPNFCYDKIEIIDFMGKIVFSEKQSFQPNYKLPVNFNKGVYILKMSNMNTSILKKIVIIDNE